MWPTFFIHGLARGANDGFVDPDIDYLCGEWLAATSGTIPTPAGASAGDTQLVVMTCSGVPSVTADGNPWHMLGNSGWIPGSLSGGGQLVLWRVYDPADGDLAWTSGGGIKGVYLSVLLKNQNDADPIFNAMSASRTLSALDVGPWWATPITGLECVESGDLAIFISHPSVSSILGVPAYPDLTGPGASESEFFCNNTQDGGASPHPGHVVSGTVVYKNRQHNLLKGAPSFDLAHWTATNIALLNNVAGTYHLEPAQLDPINGDTKHYIEQEVTLEAGKRYMLQLAFTFRAATTALPWMTILDENGNEGGIRCHTSTAGLPSVISANSSAILSSDEKDRGAAYTDQHAGNDSFRIAGFCTEPAATGTYRVRVYVSSGTDPTGSPGTSDPSGVVRISGISLAEVFDYNEQPYFLETANTAIERGSVPGVSPNIPTKESGGTEASGEGFAIVVMRRSGGPRPPCKLFQPCMKNIGIQLGDLTQTDMLIRGSYGQFLDDVGNAQQYFGICATHALHTTLSHKKFYYEMTPTAFGVNGAMRTYAIGYSPCYGAIIKPMTARVGTQDGNYNYCADGSIYEDGTLVTTVTAWSVDDNVGASIDFDTFEIKYYLNGTLVHTSDFSGTAYETALWTVHCSTTGADSSNQAASFAWNFAGPFGGRKPSGFYAYDFDNEVA